MKATKRPEAYLDEPILIREKLFILGFVNTLQPVSSAVIAKNLPKGFEKKMVRRILAALRKDELIMRLSNGQYAVTLRGRVVIGSGYLAKQRDMDRMLQLFERNKGGRGATVAWR